MALLSKTAILTADDQRYDVVQCPEWGEDGEVRVRGLTAYEQSCVSKLVEEGKQSDATIKTVQFACVDADGERMFSPDDIKQLATRSYIVIERLCKRILQLTGFGDQNEIEEARKN